MKSEDVAAYLKQNPAFFDENSDVLAGIFPPPEHAFQKRQIDVWRERHSRERARYDQLVQIARQNQTLESVLHGFVCRLLGKGQWSPDALVETVKECFRIEGVRLCLEDCHALPDGEFGWLKERVRHGGSVCDDRVSPTLLATLFGENDPIRSCAFIPLTAHGRQGILVLGSVERDRFEAGLGVIYLDRIGELMSAILCRESG